MNYSTVFRDVTEYSMELQGFIDNLTRGGFDFFAQWMDDIG